jgi:FixJ family two-component response regulator
VLDFAGITNLGKSDPAFESLSKREAEIYSLITDGLGNAEIAERLSISEKTVRNHVSNIFRQTWRLEPCSGDRVRQRSRLSGGIIVF